MLQLLRLRLLVVEGELPYTPHFLKSMTKLKEKRRNLRYKKKSGLTHLQMLLKAFITL